MNTTTEGEIGEYVEEHVENALCRGVASYTERIPLGCVRVFCNHGSGSLNQSCRLSNPFEEDHPLCKLGAESGLSRAQEEERGRASKTRLQPAILLKRPLLDIRCIVPSLAHMA